MEARYFIREATIEDAISVAERIRPEDRDEVFAATGLPPELVLPAGIVADRRVFSAGLREDNRAEILFGIDPILADPEKEAAVVWLVSTPRIFEHAPVFATASRKIFDRFHQDYPLLTNFMDARNTRHMRWVKWLGFHVVRKVEAYGPFSLPFYEFASYRPKCA